MSIIFAALSLYGVVERETKQKRNQNKRGILSLIVMRSYISCRLNGEFNSKSAPSFEANALRPPIIDHHRLPMQQEAHFSLVLKRRADSN